MRLNPNQRQRLDANEDVRKAIAWGFPEEHLALANLALGRAIQHWVHAHYPTWAPDDSRWPAWTAEINRQSEIITAAAAAYQAITG